LNDSKITGFDLVLLEGFRNSDSRLRIGNGALGTWH